jgi:hypothetical protein
MISLPHVWLDVRPSNSRYAIQTDSRLERPLAFIFGIIQIAFFVTAIIVTTTTLKAGQQATCFDAVQFSTLHVLSGSNVRDCSKASGVADNIDSLHESYVG